MSAVPLVGDCSPARMLSVVVFPAPFTPRKPNTSPRGTPKDRSRTATFRAEPKPNSRRRCLSTTASVSVSVSVPGFVSAGTPPVSTRSLSRMTSSSSVDPSVALSVTCGHPTAELAGTRPCQRTQRLSQMLS